MADTLETWKCPPQVLDEWRRVTLLATRYATALFENDEERSIRIGVDFEDALFTAQQIVKSGFLEQEYERLAEYDGNSPFTAVRWFGFAAACADFVDWLRGGDGSGRAVGPYTKVGDLFNAIKHLDWKAEVRMFMSKTDFGGANFRQIVAIHQPAPGSPVYLMNRFPKPTDFE